jgi:hypothetical protein
MRGLAHSLSILLSEHGLRAVAPNCCRQMLRRPGLPLAASCTPGLLQGYLPAVLAVNPLIGIYGFVLGSAFIAWSQVGGAESEAVSSSPVWSWQRRTPHRWSWLHGRDSRAHPRVAHVVVPSP